MHDISHPQQSQNWYRSDGRYYRCTLQQNLLHEWVLILQWGALQNHRGGSLEMVFGTYEKGLQQLEATAKRRVQRGYKLANHKA